MYVWVSFKMDNLIQNVVSLYNLAGKANLETEEKTNIPDTPNQDKEKNKEAIHINRTQSKYLLTIYILG